MNKTFTSAYWLRDVDTLVDQHRDGLTPELLSRLARIKRSVANFVSIVTGQSIPVHFSTGTQSYTDSKSIVISATDDPSLIDVVVGTALHEAAHIILSNKTAHEFSTPLFPLFTYIRTARKTVHPDLMSDQQRLKLKDAEIFELQHNLINWLEDRRIDSWMYERVPGYRGYYDAMYQAYWLHPKIGEGLKKNDPNPTVSAYLFHVINMMNEDANSTALPGLDEIWSIADLPNITRLNTDAAWTNVKWPQIAQEAHNILRVILKHAWPSDEPFKQPVPHPEAEDPENLDKTAGDPEDNDKKNKDQEDILARQKKFLNGNIDKATVSELDAELLELMNDSTTINQVAVEKLGNVNVVVHNRVTQAMIDDPKFFMADRRSNYRDEVAAGIRMGQLLASKLKMINDISTLTYTRRKTGKLDKRLVSELAFDNTDIFSHRVEEQYEDIHVHLSLDSSTSMQGEKWIKTIKLATALATAALEIPSLHVVITMRAGELVALPHVAVVFDSKRDKLSTMRTVFPHLRPYGNTPEGLCFDAIKDLIMRERTGRRFFINVSDGAPYMPLLSGTYRGKTAHRHTTGLINEFRKDGISIVSYLIVYSLKDESGQEKAFRSMYGREAEVVDIGQVSQIAKTLNRRFLTI